MAALRSWIVHRVCAFCDLPSFQGLWVETPRNPRPQSRASRWAPWGACLQLLWVTAMLCLAVFLVSVMMTLMLRKHACYNADCCCFSGREMCSLFLIMSL